MDDTIKADLAGKPGGKRTGKRQRGRKLSSFAGEKIENCENTVAGERKRRTQSTGRRTKETLAMETPWGRRELPLSGKTDDATLSQIQKQSRYNAMKRRRNGDLHYTTGAGRAVKTCISIFLCLLTGLVLQKGDHVLRDDCGGGVYATNA